MATRATTKRMLRAARQGRPKRAVLYRKGNHHLRAELLESRHLLAVSTTVLPDPFPNTPPSVTDRWASVEAGSVGRTPSVLLGQYDVEGDVLSVNSFEQPQFGKAAFNPDGTFSYEPQTAFVGEDRFKFVVADSRGAAATGVMHITVAPKAYQAGTSSFTGMIEVVAGATPVNFGVNSTVVPRLVDWNGDGLQDILVGTTGAVSVITNIGTRESPAFAAPERVSAGGSPIDYGSQRLSLSWVDMDGDRTRDLVVIRSSDRAVQWYRNTAGPGLVPQLEASRYVQGRDGSIYQAADIRADVADWNGDGRPDLVTGSWAGNVLVAYNETSAGQQVFAPPTSMIDAQGRSLNESYNLNVRVQDVNSDGRPDLVTSLNWGNITVRLNKGSLGIPLLPTATPVSVSDVQGQPVNFFQDITDGPIVDFGDLNDDGVVDVVIGCEGSYSRGGRLRVAYGRSPESILQELGKTFADNPVLLGTVLANTQQSALAASVKANLAAVYDALDGFTAFARLQAVRDEVLALIRQYPQYLSLRTLSLTSNPGIPSLASQLWVAVLASGHLDPVVRVALADAAAFPVRNVNGGGYRKLLEDRGLLLLDNFQSKSGAEAIWQWVGNVPRDIYPGIGLTMSDWLGGTAFLVRGHLKNNFNGFPDSGQGEYAFGADALQVIGARGSENLYMQVVHHESMHDMDAYVRLSPQLTFRWGQILVEAAGRDASGDLFLRADPVTGWFSESLTKQHWRTRGWWDGASDWRATFDAFFGSGQGQFFQQYGFMRGSVSWFLYNSQESLATQGNQFWNSGVGRLEVAMDRWSRGYKSNMTEVLFFMDVMSQGRSKIQLAETDDYSNQVIQFASLGRDSNGFINRVTLSDREYLFGNDPTGKVVTTKTQPPASASSAPTGLLGTVGNAQISLTWMPPSLDGGAAITDYVIQYKMAASSTWSTFNDGTSIAASTVVTGLSNGVGYVFRVAAVNYAGTSEYSMLSAPLMPSRDVLFAPLVEGVSRIAPAGVSGAIARLSTDWVPIVRGSDTASYPATFAMAREYGGGRVIALGHGGVISDMTLHDNGRFMQNTTQWLDSRQLKQVRFTTGHGEWLRTTQYDGLRQRLLGLGYETSELSGAVTEESLASVGVLMIGEAWQAFTAGEIATITRFVEQGGGLLMVGVGWAWEPYHPGSTIANFPMNLLANGFGVRWTKDAVTDPNNEIPGVSSVVFTRMFPNAAAVATQPTLGAATASDSLVSLAWQPPTSDGGAAITDYVIQCSSDGGGSWTTFNDGTSSTTSASVSGLLNGIGYVFRVAAVSSAGTGAYSANSVTVVPRTTPAAPNGLSVKAGSQQVSLTWVSPSSDGGAPVTDYVIQFSSDSGASWTTFTDGVTAATSANVTGLVNGIRYIFRVAAVNTVGTGGFSVILAAATPVVTVSFDVQASQSVSDTTLRSGPVEISKRGAGTLVLTKANSHSGGTVAESGRLVVRNSAALGTGPLTVRSGAVVSIEVGGSELFVGSLVLDDGGRVELGASRMSIPADGYSLDAVLGLLQRGYANSWAGTAGVVSSAASTIAGGTVGYCVDAGGSLTFGFAASGDTNLDGTVDILDVSAMLASSKFNTGTTASWSEGDSNYDGVIDILDISELLGAALFNAGPYLPAQAPQSQPQLTSSSLSVLDAAFVALAADTSASGSTTSKKLRFGGR